MTVIDTSAWIDYFEAGETGEKVQEALESNTCYTPAIVLAELSDNFHRKDAVSDYSWREIEAFVSSRTEIVELNSSVGSLAGKIKSEQLKEIKDFSLVDGIVAATAQTKEVEVISSDHHLEEF